MSVLCCQKAFKIIQNLQHIFWTWVWSPPLLNNVKKNCGFGGRGHPLTRGTHWCSINHLLLASPIQVPRKTFWLSTFKGSPPFTDTSFCTGNQADGIVVEDMDLSFEEEKYIHLDWKYFCCCLNWNEWMHSETQTFYWKRVVLRVPKWPGIKCQSCHL